MRILILVNSHLPDIGGRELVVHNLALQYQQLGHEVCVAGMAGWWSNRHVTFRYPVQRFPQIFPDPFLSMTFCTTLMCLARRFDVVHAHATSPIGYVALRCRALIRAPVVITPHGEDINIVEAIGFGQRLDPLQRPRIEWTVRNADATTAISQTVHASLRDAGAPENRIHDIANGVDLVRFSRPPVADMTLRYGFPAGTQLVVSTGNFHPVKGHDVLVDAAEVTAARGAPLGYVIVGRKEEAFCREVEQRGLAGLVRFAGELPIPEWGSDASDELADLLASAQFYVSSSVGEGAEGLSLSLIEGMAAGACPVVSNISGNRDMVKDRVNGRVVPPRDAQALADALIELAADPPATARMAEAAKQTASQFGWDVIATRYLDLYASLGASHRRS